MQRTARNMLWVLPAFLFVILPRVAGQQASTGASNASGFPIDSKSIGGVVVNGESAKPEAGVWVIAETKSLPVPYRKIVVTDDQGRFLVPDLPDGAYELWVRGYGLKDSERVKASRGGRVKLQSVNAADPKEAAKIYPASYWTSLIQPPSKDQLPAGFTGQDHWVATWRNACNHCHELGMAPTRRWTHPEDFDEIFMRNTGMGSEANGLGRQLLMKTLSDWASRIQAGEVPPAPPRPVGMERNVVVTQWDWGFKDSFIHDVTSTDKRNPTLYPNGKVYGLDVGREEIWELDPVKNTVTSHHVPGRTQEGYNSKFDYYHEDFNADDWQTSPHSPMLDEKGRVWITTQTGPEGPKYYPKWAPDVVATETNSKEDQDLASKLLLQGVHHRQLGYMDTKTGKFVLIETAYGNHHLQFDSQDRLWTNSLGDIVSLGMLDTTKINPDDVQGTEASAQKAWMRIDHDTNKTVAGTGYGVAVNPVDGTIWQSDPNGGGPQNKLYSFDPKTHKFKDYPLTLPGRLPHGIDASTDGKLWISTGSGHLGRFDPKSEKFTYWQLPGPKFKGTGDETGSTEFPYFLWVDQFNVFGLGKDTVLITGTTSDSLIVFDPRKETFSVLRIPYPIPFYSRGVDGRVDDPNAGWKGRGLWMSYSSYLPKFTETRSGSVNHIQLRPSPLAN
jgi:hypothetical protein